MTARRELAPAGGDAARALDWLRVALVPLLALSQLVPLDRRLPLAFAVVLALYAAYALLRLVLRHAGRPLLPDVVAIGIDIAAITALCALSGGGFSMVWHAFLVLPLAAAFEYRALPTALVGAASAVAFVVQAAAHPSTSADGAWQTIVVRTAYLLWVGAACALLAWVLERRGQRVRELLGVRERLLVDALSAEDAARAGVAEHLHDTALQSLLVARQELAEAPDGEAVHRAQTALDRTRDDLRAAVRELHPYVLDAVGLADAVRRTAEDAARRGGLRLELAVEDVDAGTDDGLLHGAARELLANVVKHAGASTVRVALARRDGAVVLEVRDDGSGPDGVEAALAAGHIGLATQRARVEAAGGTLAVDAAADGGTSATVVLPVP